MLPVTPSLGVGVVAPRTQRQPGAQGPVGAARPVPAQYMPGLQGMHAASDAPSVRFRNVPLGQGKAKDELVPRGHTNPAGQAMGVTVAFGQYRETGHTLQVLCEGTSWKVPGAQGRGAARPGPQA